MNARAASAEAGFTLIELLVVLAVMAITLAALRPLATRRPVNVDLVTAQVATSIRSAREAAIAFDRPVAMLIAGDGRGFRFSTAQAGIPMPQGIRVAYHGVQGFNRPGVGDSLTFFVDGSSTGGSVVVSDGRRAGTLHIAPLSGAVSVVTPR